MKSETLIKRYSNLGYEPKGLDINLEVASIVNWIYKTHDIYIGTWYSDANWGKLLDLPIDTKHKFQGYAQWDCSKDYTNRFTCDKYFTNPNDARFDAVRKFYKGIKFQKY